MRKEHKNESNFTTFFIYPQLLLIKLLTQDSQLQFFIATDFFMPSNFRKKQTYANQHDVLPISTNVLKERRSKNDDKRNQESKEN